MTVTRWNRNPAREGAIRLGRLGHAAPVIAATLEVHVRTVHAWLDAAGVPRLRKPAHPSRVKARALAAVRRGDNCAEAGRRCDVPAETVRTWCREAGIASAWVADGRQVAA